MAAFVLVHGAWHGGWCWQRVTRLLQAAGHAAHAVTLTGVGERAHLLSPLITLETHIADVAGLIEAEELQEVVLAVHSYAGMIGTAIADRMPHRLAHLAYVDAVVPLPGESASSTHASAVREARLAAAAGSPDYSYPPPDPSAYGLTGADHAWVARRQTPQPGHAYVAPLQFDRQRVAAVPRTFISCTEPPLPTIDGIRARLRDPAFWDGLWQGGGGCRTVEMATGHDPMVSAAQELARVLLGCLDASMNTSRGGSFSTE
jgi:pimeloyl-ACP methyl ester carboxylesterase